VSAGSVPLTFILTPRHVTTTEGSRIVLMCAANGRNRHGGAPSISWLKDGTLLDIVWVLLQLVSSFSACMRRLQYCFVISATWCALGRSPAQSTVRRAGDPYTVCAVVCWNRIQTTILLRHIITKNIFNTTVTRDAIFFSKCTRN